MPNLGSPVEPSRIENVDPWRRQIAVLDKKSTTPEPEETPLTEPIDWVQL